MDLLYRPNFTLFKSLIFGWGNVQPSFDWWRADKIDWPEEGYGLELRHATMLEF